MEPSPRGYMQTRVEMTGVQPGHTRYHRDDDESPRIAAHRNNLTALSQYQNLYFVAHGDKIYVYEPRFPFQTLGAQPLLVIGLPVSGPGLPGHISATHPHDVNQIIVDDLGDEETLACVCDDGDVLLYHVVAIARAIQLRAEPGPAESRQDPSADEGRGPRNAKPFFHINVGKSAWGVTMHKAARMLAVSNNRHVIDVIAFALRQPSSRSSSRSSSFSEEDRMAVVTDQPFSAGAVSSSPRSRSPPANNRHVELRGHEHNIPSVAFCNNRYDPNGEWLVSVDVDGVMIVWDIWAGAILFRYEFGATVGPTPPPTNWEPRECWGALCLDRSSFREVQGLREMFGMPPPSSTSRPIDITASYDLVDNSVQFFTTNFEGNDNSSEDFSDEEGSLLDQDEMAVDPVEQAVAADPFLAPAGTGPENAGGEGAATQQEGADNEAPELDEATSTEDVSIWPVTDDEDDAAPGPILEEQDQYGDDVLSSDESDAENAGEAGQLQAVAAAAGDEIPDAAHGAAQAGATAEGSPAPDQDPAPRAKYLPRFAILQTSAWSVRLLTTPATGTTVVGRRSLWQRVTGHANLAQYERLNMLRYVPELSLVVVGCQMGRVGLFTTTRDRNAADLGLRLEHTLPFATQEQAGERPVRPLLGFAIAPVQGREQAAPSTSGPGAAINTPRKRREHWRRYEPLRRYRLMLHYYDHTILSYEIGREGAHVAGAVVVTT